MHPLVPLALGTLALVVAFAPAEAGHPALSTVAQDGPVAEVEALLRRMGSPAQKEQAELELEALLEEWKALDYGIEDPFEPELTLASVLALTAFQPARLHEQAQLNERIEARLALEKEIRPELALALAQTWRTLLDPRVQGPTVERRATGLPLALRYASAIAPEKGRDAFGCYLATELSKVTRRTAPESPWLSDWLAELDRFRNDLGSRPHYLVAAADQLRVHGRYGEASKRLEEADAILVQLHEARRSDAVSLEAMLASVRFQLELVLGREEEAEASLRRQSDAAKRSGQQILQLDVLLNSASLTMASSTPQLMERELARLDEALENDGLFRDHEVVRANLFARRAIGQQLLEEFTLPSEPKGEQMLEAALENENLERPYREMVLLRLVTGADQRRDLEQAMAWLARLNALEELSPLAPEHRWYATAWRARLARETDAPRSERTSHLAAVRLAFREFLDSTLQGPQKDGGVGFLFTRNRRLLVGVLLDLALDLEEDSSAGRERVLDEVLELESLGSMARQLDAPRATVAALRAELLREDTGLLLYLPSSHGLHAFCVEARSVEHSFIPWTYEQEPDRKLVELTLAGTPELLTPAARKAELAKMDRGLAALSRRLFKGVEKRVASWKGLYLVGDDLFGGVPAECLAVGKDPLGFTHALTRLPSASAGLALARRRAGQGPPPDGVLLVGAPRIAPAMREKNPDLVEFPLDAGELTGSFKRSTPCTGESASAQGFLQKLGQGKPKVLVFVTHGTVDPYDELGSGLVLTPDPAHSSGVLTSGELLRTEFVAPPVVVLAACKSGREKRRTGDDGPGELSRVFFVKGAACTIQAGTSIALEPTTILVAECLKRLAEGASTAEAMRLARLKLAEDPAFAHPFYALSLRVVGLGLEPLFSTAETPR